MEPHSIAAFKPALRDGESLSGRIDAMQRSDTRKHEVRPPSGAAAEIEPFGGRREALEGEYAEVGLKMDVSSADVSLVWSYAAHSCPKPSTVAGSIFARPDVT